MQTSSMDKREKEEASVVIDRVFTPGLAQVAYLVADRAAGELAVIDPRRDVTVYLDWARAHRARIVAILETHVHADFVSGARELAAATGAPVYAGRLGDQDFPHTPLDDGDEIAVGRARLRALWTPGHTPEHIAYLLFNPALGEEPVALFSGDALFVGEVGRPDLLGEAQTQALAGQLFDTVTERLAPLPDGVVVYPGHTAGSSCGKKIGDAPSTTMGQEKRFNYAFQGRDKGQFIAMVLDGMPRPPAYYPALKKVNKSGAALLATLEEGRALSPADVAAAQADGALVVDTRSPEAFGAGHIPGAIFAGLGPDFTAWTGWLAPYDRALVLVLASDDRFAEAVTELRRIGLDNIAGFLRGGQAAWHAEGRPIERLPQMTAAELHARLAGPANDLTIFDVRTTDEWQMGHIERARHRFAGEIAQGADVPASDAAEIALICGSGYRSVVAGSILQARGRTGLINVTGGMDAWTAAGLPTTSSA